VTEPKFDIVTFGGMYLLGLLAVGKSQKYLTHFACGTSNALESRSQGELVREHARVNMLESGFAQAFGTSMQLSGHFNSNTPSETIWEGGVFNDVTAGTMFLRSAYTEKSKVVHVQARTNYTLSVKVSFTSIA
jgi:hypothetical protein